EPLWVALAPPISRVSIRSSQSWNGKRISASAPDELDRIASVRKRPCKTRRVTSISLPLRAGEQNCEHQNSDQDESDESAVKNSVLQTGTAGCLRVWDAGEGDPRIERQIHTRQRSFEQVIEFLFCAKCPRRRFIAHLNEITDRQIGERVGIFFSALEIFGKCAFAIIGKFIQAFVENDAIFECGVHSLPIKWNDGMGRIAEQANPVTVIPRRATNCDKRASWVVLEIFEQRRHQGNGVRKFFIEEAPDIVIRLCCGETTGSFEFPKKRAGERAIRVWQRNHHEAFARPNMERVFLDLP